MRLTTGPGLTRRGARLAVRRNREGEEAANETEPAPCLRNGIERGMERGIQVGVDEVLFVLLERVCGALDQTRRSRVEALPVARAKELALALLDFRTIEDLDHWLVAHA